MLKQIPSDSPCHDVLTVAPEIPDPIKAYRWWPPDHPRHNADLHDLVMESIVVFNEDDLVWEADDNPVQPGDWILEYPSDDHDLPIYEVWEDPLFREQFRLHPTIS